MDGFLNFAFSSNLEYRDVFLKTFLFYLAFPKIDGFPRTCGTKEAGEWIFPQAFRRIQFSALGRHLGSELSRKLRSKHLGHKLSPENIPILYPRS